MGKGLWWNNWDNAAALLSHWLDNTGEDFYLHPDSMLDEIPQFKRDVSGYLAEVRKDRKHSFDSGWRRTFASREAGDKSLDWYYALNNFQFRVTGTNLSKRGASYTVEVRKRYDWGVPSEGRLPLSKLWLRFDQPELAHLNTVGLARDLNVYGKSKMGAP